MLSMRSLIRLAVPSAFGLAFVAFVGCEPAAPSTPAPPATAPAASGAEDSEIKVMPVEPKADGKMEGAATDEVKLSDKEIAAIKKLPADEQTIAMAQKVCPVSGSHLGGMDMPIKQVVDGKTFFLCCDGCESDVKADPAGVLAKLAKPVK